MNRTARSTVWISLLVIALTVEVGGKVWGQESDATARHPVIDNLQQVVSGEYLADGTYSQRPYRRSEWLELSAEDLLRDEPAAEETGARYALLIRGAFDTSRDLFLFRRQRLLMAGTPDDFLHRFPDLWYASHPDRVIVATREPGSHRPYRVGIHRPHSPSTINRHLLPIFDVRTLPFASLESPERSIDQLDVADWLVKAAVRTTVDGTLTAYTWRNEITEVTWWCDSRQGNQVVRTRAAELPGAAGPDRKIVPLSVSKTSWKKQAGVWVPVAHYSRSRQGATEAELKLTFDWVSVNGPLDADLFEWQRWNLPGVTEARDMRRPFDEAPAKISDE